MKKTKHQLKVDWQTRELIKNLELIFQEGKKLYPMASEKEICDKIMTLPRSKAPKNKAEFFMVFKSNHDKNICEYQENATLAEGGDIGTSATSEVAELVDPTSPGIFTTDAEPATNYSTKKVGDTSSPADPELKIILTD